MAYIGNIPAEKYQTLQKQSFTTSATDTYTLSYSVTNPQDLALFINNVRQNPNDAYTVSGTTLTLSSAITSSDTMYAVFLGRAVETVAPATGSVTNAMLASGSFSNITGTGTLTNFTSTGIDDNASANALTIDSSSNLKFNSGYGSVETAFACRAWVQFNGTGTVAIVGSGNTSSITDSGTGEYIMNFTNNMPDDNYCAVCSSGENDNSNISNHHGAHPARDAPLVGSFLINTVSSSGSFVDHQFVYVAIFR